jgi:hypothetical protein
MPRKNLIFRKSRKTRLWGSSSAASILSFGGVIGGKATDNAAPFIDNGIYLYRNGIIGIKSKKQRESIGICAIVANPVIGKKRDRVGIVGPKNRTVALVLQGFNWQAAPESVIMWLSRFILINPQACR